MSDTHTEQPDEETIPLEGPEHDEPEPQPETDEPEDDEDDA